jgi:hypothetical protein
VRGQKSELVGEIQTALESSVEKSQKRRNDTSARAGATGNGSYMQIIASQLGHLQKQQPAPRSESNRQNQAPSRAMSCRELVANSN